MAKLPKLAGSSGQALPTAMETWVSSQLDLPAIHEHPRIEFAPPAKIASLRFTDFCYRWLAQFGQGLEGDFHIGAFPYS